MSDWLESGKLIGAFRAGEFKGRPDLDCRDDDGAPYYSQAASTGAQSSTMLTTHLWLRVAARRLKPPRSHVERLRRSRANLTWPRTPRQPGQGTYVKDALPDTCRRARLHHAGMRRFSRPCLKTTTSPDNWQSVLAFEHRAPRSRAARLFLRHEVTCGQVERMTTGAGSGRGDPGRRGRRH